MEGREEDTVFAGTHSRKRSRATSYTRVVPFSIAELVHTLCTLKVKLLCLKFGESKENFSAVRKKVVNLTKFLT